MSRAANMEGAEVKINSLTFERFMEMMKATWHVMVAFAGCGAWVIVTYINLSTQVKANTDAIAQTRAESRAEMESIRKQDQGDLNQIIQYLQDDRNAQKWMMKQFPAFKNGDAPDLPATPRTREEREGITPWLNLDPRILTSEDNSPQLSGGSETHYDLTPRKPAGTSRK